MKTNDFKLIEECVKSKETSLQKINRIGKTYAESLYGSLFFLVKNNGKYEIVLDGCLDEDEKILATYRLNIFGKLVKLDNYKLEEEETKKEEVKPINNKDMKPFEKQNFVNRVFVSELNINKNHYSIVRTIIAQNYGCLTIRKETYKNNKFHSIVTNTKSLESFNLSVKTGYFKEVTSK